MRRTTYFPKLSLVQIGHAQGVFLIDALTYDMELLKPLLFNDEIIKVFHSARQDLEIFYHIYGAIPKNIYDLQVASQYLGFGGQVSLENLANLLLGIHLDKANQNKNWLERPLPYEMLKYAEQDAQTIYDLYPQVLDALGHMGRRDWPHMEFSWPIDISEKVAKKALFHFKKDHEVKLYYALYMWREEKAIVCDMPRGHVLSDQELLDFIKKPEAIGDFFLKKELLEFVETLDLENINLPEISVYSLRNAKPLSLFLNDCALKLNLEPGCILSRKEICELSEDANLLQNLPQWKQELLKEFFN